MSHTIDPSSATATTIPNAAMTVGPAPQHVIGMPPLAHQLPTLEAKLSAAYEARLAEIVGVPLEALARINVDIPTAYGTALTAVPRLEALRPQLERLIGLHLDRVNGFEQYALALEYAHSMVLAASAPLEPLTALAEHAAAVRETLVHDVRALVQRGYLDGKVLSELRGGPGYRNLGQDLVTLTALLKTHRARIAGHTDVTPQDVERAEAVGGALLEGVARREAQPAVVAEATLIRQRAYTLFIRAYNEARRAVVYLRWHEGDADRFLPSIYGPRGRTGEPEAEPVDETAPSGVPAVTQGTAAQPGALPTTSAPSGAAALPIGHPGASPFAQR